MSLQGDTRTLAGIHVHRVESQAVPRRRRTLGERVLVRFPSLYQVVGRFMLRLHPQSRLRRALLRRSIESGWAAASRRDYDLMFIRYAADVDYEATAGIQSLDFPAAVRGRDAMADVIKALSEVWDEWHFDPVFFVDAGDRMVNLGRFHAHGSTSGVRLDSPWAQVLTFRDGLVIREKDVEDWAQALAIAGVNRDEYAWMMEHPAANPRLA